MGVKTDSITCPNCGSVDVYKDSEGIFHCNSCGGTFLVNLDENILNAIKKFKNLNRNPEESFTSGIITKVNYSEDEFKKKAFEYLRDSNEAPSYIFDEMECGEVELVDVPFMQITGRADVNYSRLVGFDRQETHTEFKKYKDVSGNEHIQPFEITETKTDWHTENGMLSGDSSAVGYNFDNKEYIHLMSDLYKVENDGFEDASDELIDNTKINSDTLNYLKYQLISDVYHNKITSSGDHQKDEKYDGRVVVEKSVLIIAKVYRLSIKLRDSEIILQSPAFNKLYIEMLGDLPNEDDANQFENKVNELLAEKESVSKKPKLIANLLFILAAISFVLFIFLGFNFDILVLKIFAFAIPIAAIIAAFVFKSKVAGISIQYKIKIDKLEEERVNNIIKAKQNGFSKYYN